MNKAPIKDIEGNSEKMLLQPEPSDMIAGVMEVGRTQ